jgi:hypothetical protein
MPPGEICFMAFFGLIRLRPANAAQGFGGAKAKDQR